MSIDKSIYIIKLIINGFFLTVLILLFILSFKSSQNIYDNFEEIPLVNIQGVLVKNDVIYIGLGPGVNRVQKYSLQGENLGNEDVYGGNERYTFDVRDNGEIVMFSDMSMYLDNHNLLDKKTSDFLFDTFNKYQLITPSEFVDKVSGLRYEIHSVFFKTYITKTGKKEKVIVQQKFLTNLQNVYFNRVLAFIIVAILLLINLNIVHKLVWKG